jgi:nitroimidazol reductase NimA-like FMN-containing flavoprotein (pyridoxamine 5'-phosphate oxidase superfamily)
MLTPDDRAFLGRPRIGFVTVSTADDDPPTTTPVWFECNDQSVQLFTGTTSTKARRVRQTGHASIIAANDVGEPEHWVSVEGRARVEEDGAFDLASRLAARYWDLSNPDLAAVVEAWRNAPLVRVVIAADRVRRHEE